MEYLDLCLEESKKFGKNYLCKHRNISGCRKIRANKPNEKKRCFNTL